MEFYQGVAAQPIAKCERTRDVEAREIEQEMGLQGGNRGRLQGQRPKNTYYRGFHSNGDIQPRDLPMKPGISVVSTVRLYFESSAAAGRVKKEAKE